MSGFRLEEFEAYLDEIPDAFVSIHCDAGGFHWVGERRQVDDVIAEYVAANPRRAGHVHRLDPTRLPDADAYYAVFLHNISQYIDAIERSEKPFSFTLYPGGGFCVGEPGSDKRLDRVCASPFLQRVLVTQQFTLDYLVSRHPLVEDKICYAPGGVIPSAAFRAPTGRTYFGIDKDVLEIGFVANRYTPKGEDKGYDLFVDVARALGRTGVDAKFHVVGPWDESIVPMEDLAARFVFHGLVSTERLREIGRTLDIVLSPNRPGVLQNGAFDGFPTGSCVGVGLQEAAICCTDVLTMNTSFRDGVDIILVEPSVDDIARRLSPIIQERGAAARIGKNGRSRLTELFRRETQLSPRFAVFRELTLETQRAAHQR